MEVSISFSSILQIISLIFFAGGSYVLVQYKLKKFEECQEKLKEDLSKMNDSVRDFQHTSLSRKEAFDAFVAKELLELHLKNLDKTMMEIKEMVKQLHPKKNGEHQ